MSTSRTIRPFLLGLGAAIICANLSACGNSGTVSSDGPTSATTSTGTDASIPPTSTGKKVSARPTSDRGISKTALVKRMTNEPDTEEVPKSYILCMADIVLKYGDPKDVQRYINGSIKSEKIKGLSPSNKRYWNAAEKCVRNL
ncbi:hypothetical protein ACFLIM_49860 [Nonomuraea sp. M3C6]|uniref:Uncharacterized protein n=1 Tax=Nonomuraea marmarensis TaxID=3351344 RepID=A0ABW7AYI2_9ACTN